MQPIYMPRPGNGRNCKICSQMDHSASKCPELVNMPTPPGGGGGHDHDEDSFQSSVNRLVPDVLVPTYKNPELQ